MTRILIIDDDKELVGLLGEALQQNGYEILLAFNGQMGLTLAREAQPDVILCDMMMPQISGYEVIGCLRNDERTMSIPVILMTVLDGWEKMIKATRMLDDVVCLYKPFKIKSLLSVIEAKA